MGFASMAGFCLLLMNFALLLKEDKYFLLVFSLLDFKMYSRIAAHFAQSIKVHCTLLCPLLLLLLKCL